MLCAPCWLLCVATAAAAVAVGLWLENCSPRVILERHKLPKENDDDEDGYTALIMSDDFQQLISTYMTD